MSASRTYGVTYIKSLGMWFLLIEKCCLISPNIMQNVFIHAHFPSYRISYKNTPAECSVNISNSRLRSVWKWRQTVIFFDFDKVIFKGSIWIRSRYERVLWCREEVHFLTRLVSTSTSPHPSLVLRPTQVLNTTGSTQKILSSLAEIVWSYISYSSTTRCWWLH